MYCCQLLEINRHSTAKGVPLYNQIDRSLRWYYPDQVQRVGINDASQPFGTPAKTFFIYNHYTTLFIYMGG